MKTISHLAKSNNNTHYIPISADFAKEILATFGKRIICEVNNIPIHCAILRNDSLGHYIMVGKTTKTKIKANHGDQLKLFFIKDNTPFQAAISEELKEVLATDYEANEAFEKLTPGKKRSIIHYVNSAKQSNTKINRALKIMENLKVGFTDLKNLMK